MKKSTKKWVIVSISVLFLLFILRWVGFYAFGWFNFYPETHMMEGWSVPFGIIGMVLFWVFIVLVLFSLIDHQSERRNEQSLTTLNERLSKGEIDIEEYEKIVNKIKENSK